MKDNGSLNSLFGWRTLRTLRHEPGWHPDLSLFADESLAPYAGQPVSCPRVSSGAARLPRRLPARLPMSDRMAITTPKQQSGLMSVAVTLISWIPTPHAPHRR